MSSEDGDRPTELEQEQEPSAFSWRRVGEFVRNVLRLERTVEGLKRENRELNRRIADLQRKVDEQSGQLGVLVEFINKALDERVASRAEDAAIRAFQQMAAAAGLSPGRKPRRKDRKR